MSRMLAALGEAVPDAVGRASLGPLTAGGTAGLKQLGRGAARGAGNVMEAGSMLAGSVAEKLGEAGQEGFPVARPLFEGLAETARIPSEMMARSSEELASIADRLTPPEERRGYLERLKEDPAKAPEVVQQAIFENLPQLLTAGAALKSGAAVGTGFMWLQEAGDAHRAMVEAGADEEEASLGASLVGAVNAALERAPLGRLLRKLEVPAGAVQRAKDALVQSAFEASTEKVQGMAQQLGQDLTVEGEADIRAAVEAGDDGAFAGAILGLLTGGAAGSLATKPKQARQPPAEPPAAPAAAPPPPARPEAGEPAGQPPPAAFEVRIGEDLVPVPSRPPATPAEKRFLQSADLAATLRTVKPGSVMTMPAPGGRGRPPKPPSLPKPPEAPVASETVEQLQAALGDVQQGLAAGALTEDEATQRLVGLGRVEARLTDQPLAELAAATEAIGPTEEEAAAAFVSSRPPPLAPGERGSVGAEPLAEPLVRFDDQEVERRFTRAMEGVPRESPLRRLGEIGKEWAHAIARPYRNLPQTGEFAVATEALRRTEIYPSVAIDEVARRLKEPVGGLAPEQFDLFVRKTALDDLSQLVEAGRMGEELPFGLTPETLPAEVAKVDQAVATAPQVAQAVTAVRDLYGEARERLRAARDSIGLPTDFLDSRGEKYLHHQILEYADLRSRPRGKLKAPTGRGYERRLKGSGLDYNLAFFEAQGMVMAQMLADANTAEQLARISEQSIHKQVLAEARAAEKATGEKVQWEDFIPEGYAAWQPAEGNVFYLGTTVPEGLAKQLLERGFSPEDLKHFRKAMIKGGRRTTLVLPTPLAETLTEQGKAVQEKRLLAASLGLVERTTTSWKVFQLLGPHRIVKYLSRNLVGDAQKVFQGNPRAFREVPGATTELADYFRRNETSPELAGWLALGGSAGGFYAQELGQSEKAKLRALRRSADGFGRRLQRLGSSPAAAGKAYFDTAKGFGRFAESVLRYATYRDYLAEIRASGKPHNYGASIPEQVDALPTAEEKAYWLSNQLINAYDQVSELGREMRRHGLFAVLPPIPFWSFAEQNVRSHQRLLRNAMRDDRLAGAMARKALGGAVRAAPWLAIKAGKFLALAYAFEAALHAWNYGLFEEEELDLSEDERRVPHVILGFPGLISPRDSQGRVRYFNRLSVFADAREWFGVDEFGYAFMDYLDGRMSISEVALAMAKGPAAKLYNAFSPLSTKGVVEVAVQFEGFPSVFEPRAVDSRVEQVFDLWGLGKEYRALTNQPLASGGESRLGRLASVLPSWAFYYSEPDAAAYYDTLSRARRFMAQADPAGAKPPSLYRLSARSRSLLNAKRALRYGSVDLARDYLREYFIPQAEGGMGGTEEGLAASLRSMDPLADVPEDLRPAFISWLDEDEREDLALAIQYYQEVVSGTPVLPKEGKNR